MSYPHWPHSVNSLGETLLGGRSTGQEISIRLRNLIANANRRMRLVLLVRDDPIRLTWAIHYKICDCLSLTNPITKGPAALSSPSLIVFDLDFTLWDCGGTWCDCLNPPFHVRGGRVSDRNGRHVRLYDSVADILDHCEHQSIPYAIASRTEQPGWARDLLDLLEIADRFAFAEIYPSSKLQHFSSLRDSSGIDFEEMLFFDDEMRNIREVSELGVTSIFVEDGMTPAVFHDALQEFSVRRTS